ncbi:hypothetical protein [Flyfo myovirus Tbat2_7]|nr:hypothetical protein [Flyfo myovirus Tbat2_7]
MKDIRLRNDWLILGVEYFAIGTYMWIKNILDMDMNAGLEIFSKPYLIYMPFILFVLCFVISLIWQGNVILIKSVLFVSVFYWSAFSILTLLDDFQHVNITSQSIFGVIVVIRILNLAYFDNHGAKT